MSKFTIELQHLSLPEAIAALVEAWYDNQMLDFEELEEVAMPSLIRLSDWIKSTGISRATAYELLRLLQIKPEPRRVPTSRKPVSYLSIDQLKLLQPWAQNIMDGSTVASVKAQIISKLAKKQ